MSKDVNSFQNYFNNESSQVYASTKKIFRSGHIQLNIRDANNARARKSIIVISFRPRSLQRTSLERAFLALSPSSVCMDILDGEHRRLCKQYKVYYA